MLSDWLCVLSIDTQLSLGWLRGLDPSASLERLEELEQSVLELKVRIKSSSHPRNLVDYLGI